MSEIETLLREICMELKELNKKIDGLTSEGLYQLSDVTVEISMAKDDICNKLDELGD